MGEEIISPRSFHKGNDCPELPKDTLRLYGMRFCPFTERTKLVLKHKDIKFQTANINLKHKPEWLGEKTPLGLVPVIEYNDRILYESTIITEYLDHEYATKPLLPIDPYKNAQIKMYMQLFDKVIEAFHKLFKGTEEEKTQAKEKLNLYLDMFEVLLTEKYFGGCEPNMLDLHIWPWFERMQPIKDLSRYDSLPQSRFPKLTEWKKVMMELPAVKELYIPPNLHSQFFLSILSGSPNYDLKDSMKT